MVARLPDLPKSNSKFWDKAEKYQVHLQRKPKCEHYFEYKNAREIACKSCPVGYYLSGRERLKDGKILISE